MTNQYKYLTVTHPSQPEKRQQISLTDVTTICHVDRRTAKRWATGQQKPHPSAQRLLQIYAFGEIPLLNPGNFSKMHFKTKGYHKTDQPVLVTDTDLELSTYDLDWYVQQRTNDHYSIIKLEQQCNELKNTIDRLEQKNGNVIAFAPFLRRKEYYSDKQA
jgi:hypothetical protein